MNSEDSLLEILLEKRCIPPTVIPVTIDSIQDLTVLEINENAFAKVMLVIETAFEIAKSAVESYWFYVGSEDHPNRVEEIIVPSQSISHAFVSVSITDIIEIQPFLKAELETHKWRILGWGHSHADFGVFFSGTDWQNQTRIFHETMNYARVSDEEKKLIKFSYGTTFNIHKKLYGNLTFQRPRGELQHTELSFKIISNSSETKMDETFFKEELKAKLRYK
jgi:hypothetical protein